MRFTRDRGLMAIGGLFYGDDGAELLGQFIPIKSGRPHGLPRAVHRRHGDDALVGALWAQRLRWQRGALENLGAYGVTPQTLRYWGRNSASGTA